MLRLIDLESWLFGEKQIVLYTFNCKFISYSVLSLSVYFDHPYFNFSFRPRQQGDSLRVPEESQFGRNPFRLVMKYGHYFF